MSTLYLLDTNVISGAMRLQPKAALSAALRAHETEMAVAASSWHELWFGCQRLPPSVKRDFIENYLNNIIAPKWPILPYDERAAFWHARERARLVSAGRTPSFVDGQIAAVAVINELALVTFNTSDFLGFPDLKLLDWSA